MSNSKYTEEFRSSTVQLLINTDRSVKEVSEDLGVHEKTLYTWIRSYKLKNNIPIEGRGAHFRKNIANETQDEELKRLRAENKILKQEREILKKAAAYFAKETL